MKKEEISTAILTSTEAAAYLKTSKPSLFKLVQEKKIKAAKIGRNYRFSRKELDRFVEGESEN